MKKNSLDIMSASRTLIQIFKEIDVDLAQTLRGVFPDDIVGEILQYYYGTRNPLFRVMCEVRYDIQEKITTTLYCGHRIRKQYCGGCGQFVGISIGKTNHYYTTTHLCGQNEDDRWYCYNITQRGARVRVRASLLDDSEKCSLDFLRPEYI